MIYLVLKIFINKVKVGEKMKEIDIEIMGNWADNFNSWKNYKGRNFLIIK